LGWVWVGWGWVRVGVPKFPIQLIIPCESRLCPRGEGSKGVVGVREVRGVEG
jgi:hypothetical protein